MRPMDELRRWTRPYCGLPSRPTPKQSPVRHGPACSAVSVAHRWNPTGRRLGPEKKLPWRRPERRRNPIWAFARREAHLCGLAATVNSVGGRAPVRGQRGARRWGRRGQWGTPGRGDAGKAKTRSEVGRRGLAPRRWSPPRKAVGGRGKRIASWREESRKGFVLLLWTVAARDKAHGYATAAPVHAWARTRGYGPMWATGKRARHWFFFQNFKTSTNFVIQFCDFPLSKIHQNLNRDSMKHNEQLSFLSQLRIPPEFKVINSRTISKLNIP
jgi:hypothetical protein